MSVQSVRLLTGEAVRLPGQFVQFSTWRYVVDEDGNFQLSANPNASASNTRQLDVKTATGDDRYATCR